MGETLLSKNNDRREFFEFGFDTNVFLKKLTNQTTHNHFAKSLEKTILNQRQKGFMLPAVS